MFHQVRLYEISLRVVCAHCRLHMLMLGASNCKFGCRTILMPLQSVNKKMIKSVVAMIITVLTYRSYSSSGSNHSLPEGLYTDI